MHSPPSATGPGTHSVSINAPPLTHPQGIQITHPDLVSNIWTNSWDPVDGRDNNGNGFTDDINGWDFHNNDRSVYDAPGDHHGTHVAGTIGAVQNGQVGGTCRGVARCCGRGGCQCHAAVLCGTHLLGLGRQQPPPTDPPSRPALPSSTHTQHAPSTLLQSASHASPCCAPHLTHATPPPPHTQGVVGVCPRVRIIPAKFLGSQGGFTSNAVRAVNYLTGLRQRHGLRIVTSSNSWGGGGYSDSMFNAIRNAGNAGILFVAAAGNNARDVDGNAFWPCSYARQLWNVICVAALRSNGNLAGFSNWGRNTVLLAAPGEGILSTLPTNGYGVYSGTSMAAPHVSGAIALYASRWPGASAMQIRNALIRSVMPTASLQGRTITGGRLDVNRFLATAP